MVDSFFIDPSKKKRRSRANRSTSTARSDQKRQKKTKNTPNKRTQTKTKSNNRERSNEDVESGTESVDDVDEEEVDSDVFADVGNEEIEDIDEGIIQSEEEEEFKNESEADKRRRLAKKYLEDLKASLGVNEGGDDDGAGSYEFNAKDLDDEIISSRLRKDVAEQKGWVYKFYSSKIDQIQKRKLTRVPNKCLTSVSVSYPYLFTTSKDIEISKWDIRDPHKNPKILKTVKGGHEFEEINKEHTENGHCDEIYTSAVSPDGKYLVTGGKDGRIIVWSVNSLSCIRVLETRNKKGEVLSLAFRRNSDQLYVACADLKIRTYSINQLAQLETLYGHQDLVVDISALALERCVTVGSRDRTAMLWKIADETRLTFRGGDSYEKYGKKKKRGENDEKTQEDGEDEEKVFFEGSIDCVSMIDDSHFVTGADNGNISLWSLNKKKPLFTQRISHGIQPKIKASDASSEVDKALAEAQVPEPQPFWITSIYAVPYSDIFISGSWDGNLKIWKLDETLRKFDLLENIEVNGVVTKIACHEDGENNQLTIYVTLSKEHKFTRCLKSLPGSRNALFTCIFNLKK